MRPRVGPQQSLREGREGRLAATGGSDQAEVLMRGVLQVVDHRGGNPGSPGQRADRVGQVLRLDSRRHAGLFFLYALRGEAAAPAELVKPQWPAVPVG